MTEKIVVTSYTEPDLDGFSCAMAYAEFLNKTGVPAVVRIFGTPHIEATYLLQKFGFSIEEDKTAPLDKVVLVDASELRDLDQFIRPENVVEVIDHRKFNDSASFKNAKIQIEFVGSAATLIAEKFYKNDIDISVPAATLLYGAIVSNTLNFRAKVTTDRDRQMAEWLNHKLGLTQEFIDDMFRAKSDVFGEKLAQRIDADFAWFQLGNQKIGIAQMEMMDVKPLLEARKDEILNILEDLKLKDQLDKIFISFIDLGESFNAFLTKDHDMQSWLSRTLDIQFTDDIAFRPNFIMRKEIVPLLKEKFYETKILIFLHGTAIMHSTGKNQPREIRVQQSARRDPEVLDYASYIPVEGAVEKIYAWKKQGADICYLSSHEDEADVEKDRAVLKRFNFPDGDIFYRKNGESYATAVEQIMPDILIEDDCESIGGVSEMTYPSLRAEIKSKIKSIVVKEFQGIDHLSDNLNEL